MRTPIAHFCTWLSNTALAHALQTSSWIIPALQTVHILSVALVVAGVTLLSLRVLGAAGKTQVQAEAARRLRPIILAPIPVLLLTGLLQITAEPERSLFNEVFWLKMGLLTAGLALFGVYWRHIRKATDPAPNAAVMARSLFALTSLGLWGAIVFAGRLIAYAQ
jgi:hypothetical protein